MLKLREYKIKIKGISFRLIFRSDMTLIDGYSGIGKTLLFKQIRNDSLVNNKDILCLNYEDVKSGNIQQVLSTAKGKVIFIDNAEIVLNKAQRMFVSLDTNNQYVILSHVTDGFKPRKSSLTDLIVEKGKGYLEYAVD